MVGQAKNQNPETEVGTMNRQSFNIELTDGRKVENASSIEIEYWAKKGLLKSATLADEVDPQDWELVVGAMTYREEDQTVKLSDSQSQEVYLEADGFGDLKNNPEALETIGWDWSHIRDSSPKAVRAMAAKIRSFIVGQKADGTFIAR
jgi:hypothetical protein